MRIALIEEVKPWWNIIITAREDRFNDPDFIIDVETVDNEAGI